jgi:hypothetical protein
MESWTPQDWVLIIGAVVGGLGTIICALGAGAKYYIDHLGKAQAEQITQLQAAVKQLQHDRRRDRRRIKQLVQALKANNIPVPPEEPDDEEEE